MNTSLRININAWLLILPAAVFLVAFTYYPVAATFINSLFSTGNALNPSKFVGLENYDQMIHDPVFWQALRNNLIYSAGIIPSSIALALLMAIWVNRKIPGRAITRMAYFTPTMLPMIAIANIWLFFYSPDIGLINNIANVLGFSGYNWLGDPNTVLACITLLTIWKEAGLFMIFYLAALQTMPPDLEEAARMAGASRWYFFRRVTFPLLMPTTLFVLINAVIFSFTMVDQLFVLTKGGPGNASNLLLYYVYEVAFSYLDTSYAAALTAVLIGMLAIVAITQFYLLERRTHYQ